MGEPQSKPTQEEYDECKAKVKDFEKQLKQCSARDHNQMESSQTNVGIFSLGVENNSNGSGECDCGFWGVLEVLVCITIAVLVLFLFIRFVMSYIARRRMWKEEKEQRKEKWLDEMLRRRNHTAIQMSEDCSASHLHLPKYMKSITNGSAPPAEAMPEPGVFEQPDVNFQAGA